MTTETNEELIKLFSLHFAQGKGFSSIAEARRVASILLKKPVVLGTSEAKQVDEAIEAAVIRTANVLINEAKSPPDAYRALVDLHNRQPRLDTRTSTSILRQAYSTPVPIAYLVSTLAGITPETIVYEPCAGNGSLLIGTNPKKATVNELSPERAAELRAQGFLVTEHDATTYVPDSLHDAVILNPPFGAVSSQDGQSQRFDTGHFLTTKIDHAIPLNALKAMKPEGRAVLIVMGEMRGGDLGRYRHYNTGQVKAFYETLYKHYNVTDHFTVSGALYRRQGGNCPIDIIVIKGQGSFVIATSVISKGQGSFTCTGYAPALIISL